MRVLLDENLDWRLSRYLPGHEVDSVARSGCSGVKNGVLLRQAATAGYQVLVTLDGNLIYQQSIMNHGIAGGRVGEGSAGQRAAGWHR